jgi:hypothetical protein
VSRAALHPMPGAAGNAGSGRRRGLRHPHPRGGVAGRQPASRRRWPLSGDHHEANQAFPTALALQALYALDGSEARHRALRRGVAWLIEHQRRDGSWPAQPMMLRPTPHVMRTWELSDWRESVILDQLDQPDANDPTTLPAQWQPIIDVVAAVARGDHAAPGEPTELLDELADSDDWAALAGVLARILNGDRDREQLLGGLDAIDTTIVTAVLDQPDTTRQDDDRPAANAVTQHATEGRHLERPHR